MLRLAEILRVQAFAASLARHSRHMTPAEQADVDAIHDATLKPLSRPLRTYRFERVTDPETGARRARLVDVCDADDPTI